MQVTKKITGLFVIAIIIANDKQTSGFTSPETRSKLYDKIAETIKTDSAIAMSTPAAPIAAAVVAAALAGMAVVNAGLLVMENQVSSLKEKEEPF